MRRREFHHSVFRCEAEKLMKLIAAAILYFAGAGHWLGGAAMSAF